MTIKKTILRDPPMRCTIAGIREKFEADGTVHGVHNQIQEDDAHLSAPQKKNNCQKLSSNVKGCVWNMLAAILNINKPAFNLRC